MTASNDTPDPDRDDQNIVNNDGDTPPQVFVNIDSEEEEVDVSEHGYEMLQQNDNLSDNEDDGDGDDSHLSREEQIAALVRAAQSDPVNLSEATRELIEESNLRQRTEEVAESARVWSDDSKTRDSIPMTDDKIQTIKNLMSGMVLPNVPAWANNLDTSTQIWKEKVSGQSSSKVDEKS